MDRWLPVRQLARIPSVATSLAAAFAGVTMGSLVGAVVAALIGALGLPGARDPLQCRHAILVSYPVIGPLRGLLENARGVTRLSGCPCGRRPVKDRRPLELGAQAGSACSVVLHSEAPVRSRRCTVMARERPSISTSPKNCRPALGGRLTWPGAGALT